MIRKVLDIGFIKFSVIMSILFDNMKNRINFFLVLFGEEFVKDDW